MRIKDFLPESWWKDLDPGFLSMMGYTQKETVEAEEDGPAIDKDVEAIRSLRRPHKL